MDSTPKASQIKKTLKIDKKTMEEKIKEFPGKNYFLMKHFL